MRLRERVNPQSRLAVYSVDSHTHMKRKAASKAAMSNATEPSRQWIGRVGNATEPSMQWIGRVGNAT
jgi:hypothetical protein